MSRRLFLVTMDEEEFAKQDEDTKQDILDSEVILCRDCKMYVGKETKAKWTGCREWSAYVEEDDFCSRGVRR